ncbi:fimbrial protein [Providencia vermicola]|nr:MULTISPECIES: fimbrial protein [Providencia]MCK1144621.1 type 1 fimbrial protein [Providencia stuartii]MCR4180632.1 type 1 fimbrial protein [Providencia vermicola]URE78214.1 type 1 fimbrial protein [Providencia stuartii]WBA57533.1 fimbrial protein [Providencia sp. 21OH12SH02B-Prov]
MIFNKLIFKTKNMSYRLCQLCSFIFVGYLLNFSGVSQAETVQFDGVLVEDACEVYPGDENIELDFGTVVDKYLYLNTRTHSQPFTIRLINCDLVLGKEVRVTFTGNENLALPGLLALDRGSQASGIAIGLETENGTPIILNKVHSYIQNLHTGNGNDLNLKAYIQGEPNALLTKKIGRGEFYVTTKFVLEYE